MIENGGPVRGKKKKRRITAFYIEALLLVAAFTMVILVLTRVFAWAGQLGREAGILTKAVHLAENAAEAVAASDSPEDLERLLDENGNVRLTGDGASQEGSGILIAWYDEDLNPASEGSFRVEVAWKPQGTDGEEIGSLLECSVSVYWIGDTEPVYGLETALYAPGR